MSDFQLKQTQSISMQQSLAKILCMEQAHLLEMPYEEFSRLILEIEKTPIFQRLYQRDKVVYYQRFPRTNISFSFYRLKEDLAADGSSIDIESLLLNKGHIVNKIRRIGVENFKRYFLFPEPGVTLDEIAGACNLEASEVREINNLINDLSIASIFHHPSNVTSGVIRYSKVASVERSKEGFIIGYFSLSSARGRYAVNYERFEELRSGGILTEAEVREARQLFKKLELINGCKNTLNLVLQGIIDQQSPYLESGDPKSLLPFSQKELAETIGLTASAVSRAIKGKSMETPWGQEVPLKRFFPRTRVFKKDLVRQLLEEGNRPPSDEAIRIELGERFDVTISRRTIADLRKELGFLAAYKKRPTTSSKEIK